MLNRYIASLICICCCAACTTTQHIPKQNNVIAVMEKANNYFMNKWPDAGKSIITNKERPSNIWTRAVYYEGLMALYSIDKKKAYYDYTKQWGDKHNWQVAGGIETGSADNHCAGQTYIDMFLIDKDSAYIKNIKASIDKMVKSEKADDWWWIDALQMAMPVFVRLGNVFNDSSYYNKMYEMYAYTKYKHGGNGLYNPQDHLWWRDKDFVPPYKEPDGEDCYWSRGNGWVLAALTRTLMLLPESNSHYAAYKQDYLDMVKAIAPLQQKTGLWTVSLHDPSHFGGKEISGSSLFVYGMAWGINKGWLDKKTYLPVVTKAWNAIVKDAVHPDGKLGYVQGTGKEPKDGQPVTYNSTPDFEDYGLGCFLLAGSEVYKL
ncbi:glycoside hydrolase family 88 protein [Parafilimonas sp.]|uniref:glycoside hydrolase family 88/105 protein n=1 Tax=Parafilimonas sp. TaxID=1969739 RepID=UPI0039E59981